MSNKIKIYMGVPSNGTVIDSQSYLLREIQEIYKDHVELVYPDVCVRRMFHDFARNVIVDDFLASGCDVLWFLDSDITPSKHILDLVALHYDKWKVAGATYPVFMPSPETGEQEVIFTCYEKNPNSGNLTLRNVPQSGTAFVGGLATGCLFIKREVFSLLEKPYFEFKFDPESRQMTEGEDLGFCRKLSNLDIQIFTDFTLVCKHQKNVDLLDINNYAIAYSNKILLAYDEMVKSQVKEAAQAAFLAGVKEGIAQNIEKHLHKPTPKPTIWTPSLIKV